MKNTMFTNFDALKQEAKDLVDDGANIEYTRGVLEIISSFISYGDDCCHADNVTELAKEIGLSFEVISKLY